MWIFMMESNPITDIFRLAEREEIALAVFKNIHRVSDALDGGADLDLLLLNNRKEDLFQLLHSNGWFLAINPSTENSDIVHFFNYNSISAKTYHIHLYVKLYTGHSWIKEYLITANPPFRKVSNLYEGWTIPFLDQTQLSLLHELRIYLKKRTITGRILKLLHSQKYDRESKILDSDKASKISKIGRDIIVKNELGYELNASPRLSALAFSFQLLRSFFLRLYGKLISLKKLPNNGGKIVVITGPDGSGKSTLVKHVSKNLSAIYKVRSMNVGRPYGKFINNRLDQSSETKKKIKKNTVRRSRGLIILRAMIVAFLRYCACWYLKILCSMGYLVICDRWPNEKPGTIDGPRLGSEEGIVGHLFERAEHFLYRTMPKPNLLLFLKVDLETVIARNRQRDKKGKETDKEIRARFFATREISYDAQVIKEIDNNCSAQESQGLILEEINGFLR